MSKSEELPTTKSIGQESRVDIVNAVKTPLGFFALVILIVEAIVGIVAGTSSGDLRTYLAIGMLVAFLLVIVIVAVLAFFRPLSLYGLQAQSGEQLASATNSIAQELLPVTERALKNAEQQYQIAQETLRTISKLFPQLPKGVELHEWQIVTGLLRDQVHLSGELLDSARELDKRVNKHLKE